MATVLIIESELGWGGQKVEDTIDFPTHEEAERYVREYNPPMDRTPDWYMYAKLEDDDSYGMMR